MVAITASLEMSSQVGATAVRTRSAASAIEPKQNPGGESEPDLAALHFARAPRDGGRHHGRDRLDRAERHHEHGTGLDNERDIARDHAELSFE
jgi:hypothetical protein